MLPTDLTVAAVVKQDDRYLMIEETASGLEVITQPGGHIENNESPEEACVREILEETRCNVRIDSLLGVYLWIQPQTRQQFLRIVFVADYLGEDPTRRLDHGIRAVRWMSIADIRARQARHRTPIVLRCLQDYLDGKRHPQSALQGLSPVQQRVSDVLATASLV